MSHSFIFRRNNILKKMESFLEVEGDDNLNTAMAKTVGMPIALLVEYIINNNFRSPGIHLPFEKNIYEFILKKMDSLGIRFEEIELIFKGIHKICCEITFIKSLIIHYFNMKWMVVSIPSIINSFSALLILTITSSLD